jgi:hypothetical protein
MAGLPAQQADASQDEFDQVSQTLLQRFFDVSELLVERATQQVRGTISRLGQS